MPTPEIVDQAAFASFLDSLDGDVDFLSEMVEEYLASTRGLFASMQQAIATGEAPALQRAAHSLKTGSATLGALTFAARCKEMEDLGKMGDLTCAEDKLRGLEAEYKEVVTALRACVESTRQ